MGCTRCGPDTKLIELMFTKLVQEALKDGTLQAGLVDCSEKRLEKNTNVVTCNALEDLVCDLIKNGEICINEPEALIYDKDAGKLSLVMSDGSTISTTLGADESHLSDVLYDPRAKVATFKMSDDNEFTLNLGDFIGRNDLGRGLVMNGTKVGVLVDGTTITFDPHGLLTANTTEYVDVFGDPYITAF